MAPEQLEGKDADPRTDVFALAAVLSEMPTGRRAFEAGSQASVIAAILDRDPPPLAELVPMAPPALDRLVQKCLAKDPERRWCAITVSMTGFFTASANGVLVYRSFTPPIVTLRWFDRSGNPLDVVGAPAAYSNFRLAPDGRRVAADITDFRTGSRSIWILDPGRGAPARLTFAGTHDWEPVWSPAAARIAFASYRDGPLNLFVKPSTGSGVDEPLVISDAQKDLGDWSSDGRFIAYRSVSGSGMKGDVWVLPVTGDRDPIPVARSEAEESGPRFASDGRWIAYASDESGTEEVYVQPFPPTGAKWQVSENGGRSPAWRGDGREMYCIGADGVLRAVDVLGTSKPFRLRGIAGGLALVRKMD